MFVRGELDDFKHVKNAFGGTVNDVVLTVVSGGLRKWLRSRGVRTEGLELRALVPMSIRSDADRGAMGNRIAAMRGPLPVYVEDPVARLRVVRAAMDGLKESKQAVGAEVLAGVQNFAPPTVLAQASRLNFSTRLFNLLVTNVPGPQFPLYVLGRRLNDLFPVAFLPRHHALAIAIMSYDGGSTSACSATTTRCTTSTLRRDGRGLADGAARRRGEGRRSNGSAAAREDRSRSRAAKRQARREASRRRQALSSRARTSRLRTSCPGSTAA